MVKIDEEYLSHEDEYISTLAPTTPYVKKMEELPLLSELMEQETELDHRFPEYSQVQSTSSLDDFDQFEEESTGEAPLSSDVHEIPVPESISVVAESEEELLEEYISLSSYKSKKRNIWYILGGEMLAHPSVRYYLPAVITLIVMILVHIGNNYNIIEKRIQIDKLEKKVQHMTYMQMGVAGALTRKSYGMNLEEQIKKKGSKLEVPQVPPIVIYREKK